MIDDVGLAPLGAVWPGVFGAVGDGRVEEEVVDFILAELVEGGLGEEFGGFEV